MQESLYVHLEEASNSALFSVTERTKQEISVCWEKTLHTRTQEK